MITAMTIASIRHALGALGDPRHQRDDDRGEQQVDQRVGELGEELPPGGHGSRRLELVRAVALDAGSRLGRAQPELDVRAQLARDVGRVAAPRLGRGWHAHSFPESRTKLRFAISTSRSKASFSLRTLQGARRACG